jgi:hypothetical protein
MANNNDLPVDFDCANTCYRVCGYRMTASRVRYLIYRAAYLSLLLYRRLESLSAGPADDDVLINALGYYYEGPYPLFWSGLIVQGRLNPTLLRYVAVARRHDLRALLFSDGMKRFSTL